MILPEEHARLRKWLAGRPEFTDHVVFRTSGSSGVEKWVALSKEALEWSARRVIATLGMTADDVCGLALPTVHVGGFGLMVRAYLSGAALVEFEGKWNAERFGDWCAGEGVTMISLVPTQVSDLVEGGIVAPACLGSVVVGGGVLKADLAERAKSLGWPVLPSYGMTETAAQVATGEGLPLMEGWEAKVEEGCLSLKGGGLLTSVIRQEGEQFVAIDPKAEGWFRTSDRVALDGRNLRILGRADRRVKVLGELVDLEVLEEFWRENLGCEVALIARPDARRGAELILFVEGEGEGLDELNGTLPGPERWMACQVLSSLPKSPLGKIDRNQLREITTELRCFARDDQEG
ncbi:AMP-binding protein [Verrucomicrobiaceae bacterium 227]